MATHREMAVVLVTAPDDAATETLVRSLIEERLAACVVRIPGGRSAYLWEGRVQDDPEVLLVIKTARDRLAPLRAWIEERHPYEVPAIVALPAEALSDPYHVWLLAQTRP